MNLRLTRDKFKLKAFFIEVFKPAIVRYLKKDNSFSFVKTKLL